MDFKSRDEQDAWVKANVTHYNCVAHAAPGQVYRQSASDLAMARAIAREMLPRARRAVSIYAVSGVYGAYVESIMKTTIHEGTASMKQWINTMPFHVIVLIGDAEPKVRSYQSRESAENDVRLAKAEVDKLGSKVYQAFEPNDLKAMTTPELVKLCNYLKTGNPIKSFHDKEAAAARIWGLLTTNRDPEEAMAPAVVTAPVAPGAAAPAGSTEKPEEGSEVAKAKGKGARKTTKAKTAAKPAAKKAGAKKENGVGRARKFSDDMVIHKLVDGNPKRANSAAGKRYSLYREGQTVKAALAAGVWPADLNWDTKQKFIKISKPA